MVEKQAGSHVSTNSSLLKGEPTSQIKLIKPIFQPLKLFLSFSMKFDCFYKNDFWLEILEARAQIESAI